MSNARINIADQLASIIAPNLDASNYAHQLNQVFTNIDNNFTKLANHDFIKGERGDSVKIQEVELISSTTNNTVENEYNIDGLTEFGELLLNSIKNNFITDSNILDINIDENTKLTWLDNFKSNPGKLYMIYDATTSSIDEDKAYSSLYYTFLDGRYVNSTIGKLDPSNYQDVSDMSCIAIYDKDLNNSTGGFKIISNAFPTIYYEDGIGLCWKVNGNNTGIPVQGIKGKDGVDSAIYIVSAKLTVNSVNSGLAEGPVTGIFEPFTGYKDIANIDISSYDNRTALVMTNNLNRDARSHGNGNEFYFGTLKTKTENDKLKLFASCSPTTSITQSIGVESVINSMKNIDIFATGDAVDSIPRGLFIPIADEIETKLEDGSPKREQPVHLLSATPISPEEGTISDAKTDVIFTPVDDYNSVKLRSESNEETTKKLKVDKYLYVQINKNHSLVKENHFTQNLWGENNSPGVSAGTGANFFIESFPDSNNPDTKLKYDGVLKYKLDSVVKLEDDNKENLSFDGEYELCTNGIYNSNNAVDTGSISFGTDIMDVGNTINFSKETVCYTKNIYNDNETLECYDSHRMSIPEEFSNCNLYRWILCDEKQEKWDIEELKKYSEDEYTFPDRLRIIYTTEMSPTINTKFLWFNGCNYFNSDYKRHLSNSEFFNKPCIVRDVNKPEALSIPNWHKYPRIQDIVDSEWKGMFGGTKRSSLIYILNTVCEDIAKLYSNFNIKLEDIDNNKRLVADEKFIEITKDSNGNITGRNLKGYDKLEELDVKKILAGWQYCDFNGEELLKFKKFVPIYNNDFKLTDDTALNLNYNVNITGDENNPKKSITVHGHVNCDDLNVHNLTSSGEIKNIFTKDIIHSESGLKLGGSDYPFCELNKDSCNFSADVAMSYLNGKRIESNYLSVANAGINDCQNNRLFISNGIGIKVDNTMPTSVFHSNNISIFGNTNNTARETRMNIDINKLSNISIKPSNTSKYDNEAIHIFNVPTISTNYSGGCFPNIVTSCGYDYINSLNPIFEESQKDEYSFVDDANITHTIESPGKTFNCIQGLVQQCNNSTNISQQELNFNIDIDNNETVRSSRFLSQTNIADSNNNFQYAKWDLKCKYSFENDEIQEVIQAYNDYGIKEQYDSLCGDLDRLSILKIAIPRNMNPIEDENKKPSLNSSFTPLEGVKNYNGNIKLTIPENLNFIQQILYDGANTVRTPSGSLYNMHIYDGVKGEATNLKLSLYLEYHTSEGKLRLKKLKELAYIKGNYTSLDNTEKWFNLKEYNATWSFEDQPYYEDSSWHAQRYLNLQFTLGKEKTIDLTDLILDELLDSQKSDTYSDSPACLRLLVDTCCITLGLQKTDYPSEGLNNASYGPNNLMINKPRPVPSEYSYDPQTIKENIYNPISIRAVSGNIDTKFFPKVYYDNPNEDIIKNFKLIYNYNDLYISSESDDNNYRMTAICDDGIISTTFNEYTDTDSTTKTAKLAYGLVSSGYSDSSESGKNPVTSMLDGPSLIMVELNNPKHVDSEQHYKPHYMNIPLNSLYKLLHNDTTSTLLEYGI